MRSGFTSVLLSSSISRSRGGLVSLREKNYVEDQPAGPQQKTVSKSIMKNAKVDVENIADFSLAKDGSLGYAVQ